MLVVGGNMNGYVGITARVFERIHPTTTALCEAQVQG